MQVHLPDGVSLRVRSSLTLEKVLSIVANSLRQSPTSLEVYKKSPFSKERQNLLADQQPICRLRDLPEFASVSKSDWPSLMKILRQALPIVAPLDATLAQLTTTRELIVALREMPSGSPLLRVKLPTGDLVIIGHSELAGGLSAPVRSLKELIYSLTDIPVDMQRLFLRGRTLLDARAVDRQGVVAGAMLDLVLPLPGGTIAGNVCIRQDGCGLWISYEPTNDPFFDCQEEGKAVAASLLSALAADVGGCELRASSLRPKLFRHHPGQRLLADALSVWHREELLALLSVRRVLREWSPQKVPIIDLLLPWLALPPAEWTGSAEVRGRTLKELRDPHLLLLRFEPAAPSRRPPQQMRLAAAGVAWPDKLLATGHAIEVFLKACDATVWQLPGGKGASAAEEKPAILKIGVRLA